MHTPETNDPLDTLLRDDAYVEDDGFTARVLAELPPRLRGTWVRPAILFSAAVIGFVLLAWWLPPLPQIFVQEPNGAPAVQFSTGSLLTAGALLVAAGSVLWGIFAAIRED